jgi:hypothetical protein
MINNNILEYKIFEEELNEILTESIIYVNNSDLKYNNILFENITKNNLNTLENVFDNLKKSFSNNVSERLKINEELKRGERILGDITGLKTIDFKIYTDKIPNAMIGPYYDFLDFGHFFPKIFDKNLKEIPKLDNSMKGFFLLFTSGMINICDKRELIAILLHELGHIYKWPSMLNRIFLFFLKILNKSSMLFSVRSILVLQIGILPITLLLALILSKTINFFDHREEYAADNFAVQFGYGKELVSSFKKMESTVNNYTENLHILQKFIHMIYKLFLYRDTHPNFEDRIDKILTDIKKEYVNQNDFAKSFLIKQVKDLNFDFSKIKEIKQGE